MAAAALAVALLGYVLPFSHCMQIVALRARNRHGAVEILEGGCG